jgi:hypothetical protein
MAESRLGQQLGIAVRAALVPAARYLAEVGLGLPQESLQALLHRPDVTAVLQAALDEAREAAAAAVQQAWDETDAPGHPALTRLLGDVDRQLSSVSHLHGAILRAHREGVRPAEAVLGYGRAAALKSRLSVSVAESMGRTASALADAIVREAGGEALRKRWRAHIERPSCCFWCRKLNGVTIVLRESFAPYLGGPAELPHQRQRRIATPAGSRRFGSGIGTPIIVTHPPRPYHGDLQGPGLHPFCQCWLEIVRLSPADARESEENQPALPAAPAGFLSAAAIRDMPEARYRALLTFVGAATHELGQVLRRLAGHGRNA